MLNSPRFVIREILLQKEYHTIVNSFPTLAVSCKIFILYSFAYVYPYLQTCLRKNQLLGCALQYTIPTLFNTSIQLLSKWVVFPGEPTKAHESWNSI